MAWIPAAVHAEIKNNDLNKVLFQDPLGDETRKAKRNLLIAAFTCLLIAVLKLHVTSFLGLSAGTDGLGNELAKGLSVLVVIYMLVGYCFHVFVDYAAWKFERERLQTQPYFDFISLYESSYRAMTEQIANAVGEIPTLKRKPQNFNEQGIERAASECLVKLENIDKHIQELRGEGSPLIASWKKAVAGMDRLSWRLRARFFLLWVLDIILPIALSGYAIYKTIPAIAAVYAALLG